MSKNLVRAVVLCSMAFVMSLSAPAFAQQRQNEQKMELTGTRKQLATIIFSGLAGAILGLSTLSFYGRPQEHLSNIAVGFAIGVIGGTIYTTYRAATRPYDVYDLDALGGEVWEPKQFAELAKAGADTNGLPMTFSYSWEF